MKLTGKQRKELRARISVLLLDENMVGDMPAFIWANLDWRHEEVTNNIMEAIELD